MSGQAERKLIRAAAVIDARGIEAAPGAVLLEGRRVIAAGSPSDIGTHEEAVVIEEPSAVILPAMVNAHCHLDLSRLEPRPFPGRFESWREGIAATRAAQEREGVLRADCDLGIELSLAGGVAFVGDIAGAGKLEPLEALRSGPLGGVSFIEFFGLGTRQQDAIARMGALLGSVPDHDRGVGLGVSPHAPYSCGAELYEAAMDTGLPLATHLAESLEEEQVLRSEDGPFRELADNLGAWNEGVVMPGVHPVDALAECMDRRSIMLVHLNYIEDDHVDLLVRSGACVAYCPRASDYFGHPHGGRPDHQYGRMFQAGLTVALGTDSRTCLDTPDRIGVLDEMRHLFVRDGADPAMLLEMATRHGARALGLDESLVTFEPGPVGGVLAVDLMGRPGPDPLQSVLAQRNAPRWIIPPDATGL